jgi:hypothetical protein
MTAKGKINAANVQVGDRVIMKVYRREVEADRDALDFLELDYAVGPSSTKTGEGVQVARVISKSYVIVAGGGFHRRDRRVYLIETSVGKFEASPIQTMILAPEDTAGIKRAHVEALDENKRQDRAATPAEVEATTEADALRTATEAARVAPTQTEAAEIMAAAMGLPVEALASWVATNWTGPAAQEDEEDEEAPEATPATEEMGEPSSTAQAAELDEDDENGMHPECEAKGCDLPEGAPECRRCGAEPLVIEDEDLTLHSQDGKVDNMNETSETQTPAETTPAERHTGSSVVKLIEKVWDRIRADHPELPEVVVTTGSGEGVKWGHFRADSWKLEGTDGRFHEFFLASEALAKGAHQVLQTTIHEAAHTISKARGIKDTSRQGRWHNAEFKKAAEELGLEHKGSKAHASHGFSFVTLTQATKDRYADLLAELDQELKLTGLLPFWLGGKDEEGGEDEQGGEKITGKPKGEGNGTKSGPLKATCQCAEPVIIRLSQKVLDMGVVKCTDCDELFRAA